MMSRPSATQLLHAHKHSPVVEGCAELQAFPCWLCGAQSQRGMSVTKWLPKTFTAQNRARAPQSISICEACIWATEGKPPDTLRMYSHLFDGDYQAPNKGGKPAMRAFLRARHTQPWFAAIADSGQKHVIPWAPVNPPGSRGRVMFEEQIVELGDWAMLDELAELLTAGASKDDVARGDYSPFAWQRCAEQIRGFEARWAHLRGGAWFALVVFLAQRDEAAVAERQAAEKEAARLAKEAQKAAAKAKKPTPKNKEPRGKARRNDERTAQNEDRGRAARPARGVPRNAGVQPAEALGSARGPDASGSAHDGEPRGVGDEGLAGSAAPGAEREQLSLFA